MPEPQWKSDFRRQLEKAGESQVRTEFHTLATGGEDRRLFLVDWLRREEQKRQAREDQRYLVMCALAFVAAAAGVVAAIASVIAVRTSRALIACSSA
jgi:hypothetical protein